MTRARLTIFPCRLCLLGAFHFISLLLPTTAGGKCLCGSCKMSPRTSLLCSYIFLVLRDHVFMLLTFEKKSTAHALGASVVWHIALFLMNSFNKTEAAIFPCRLCFLWAFLFISFILPTTAGGKCLCGMAHDLGQKYLS